VEEAAEAAAETENSVMTNFKKFTFQWHITDACNLRCRHCYQESHEQNHTSTDDLILVLNKIEDFTETFPYAEKFHINITGGEPFVHPDFFNLLHEIESRKKFAIGILSNGFITGPDHFKKLRDLNLKHIQLSLEGSKRTHEKIRGKGTYKKVIESMKLHRENKIPFMVSFTANSENYMEFGHAVKTAIKYGAFKVWTDRYIPSGINDPLCLKSSQAEEYFRLIQKEKTRRRLKNSGKTEIASHRALQFLQCGGTPYSCSAGSNLLCIMPNGDVYPCRRMPVPSGNVHIENIIDNYEKNSLLMKLRRREVPPMCRSCYYKDTCSGGLKCLSLAMTGDPFSGDPHCLIGKR